MKIGVLALQGDFREHSERLSQMGHVATEIRTAEHLWDCSALIIPGGESTTMGKLATSFGLLEPLREFGSVRPIWGTCAGAIFLSQDERLEQPLLGLMDIKVQRNKFGRQIHSFETELYIPDLESPEEPFHAVFIRAPVISHAGQGVKVLARLPADQNGIEEQIVAARQNQFLATCFHPELAQDARFHRYFLGMTDA